MPSSLPCLFSPAVLRNGVGSPGGTSTPPQPLILRTACSKYELCYPVNLYFLHIQYQKVIMLAKISPNAVVSVQMLVATSRYILVLNPRSMGRERFIYQRRGKKEKQTLCKTPLPRSQFTFCQEKELNSHVNPFELKRPPSNSEKAERKICKPHLPSYFLPPRLCRGSTQVPRGSLQMFSAPWQSCCEQHVLSRECGGCFAPYKLFFLAFLLSFMDFPVKISRSRQPPPQDRGSWDQRLQS